MSGSASSKFCFVFFPPLFDMLCSSSVIDRHDVQSKMNCKQAFCNVVVRCRKMGNILYSND